MKFQARHLQRYRSNLFNFLIIFFLVSCGGGGGSSGGKIPFSKLNKYPVDQTSLSLSSSLGNSISNGLRNKFTYAYDALHGGFKIYVSDFINTENKNNQKIKLSINEELENLRKIQISGQTSNDIFEGEYINFKNM